jgi:hypothetical protein
MARGKKHTADQVVNLLRQIEAAEREAKLMLWEWGSRRAVRLPYRGNPVFRRIFAFIGFCL